MPDPAVYLSGPAQPHPAPLRLYAGPLTALFEPHTGMLRYIRCGHTEILRAIYIAVRDPNWNTVPARLEFTRQDVRPDQFLLAYHATCRAGPIAFEYTATLTGSADGRVSVTLDGHATSSFRANRIGICVLHPMTCAGVPCRVLHADGSATERPFPQLIAPHQPFKNIRSITQELAPGLHAHVQFTGHTFEMEDQRNWSDASFKTYCRPLEWPYPYTVNEGELVQQTVDLSLLGHAPAAPPRDAASVELLVDPERLLPMPKLGVMSAAHGQRLTPRQSERLRALALGHLRVDLFPGERNWFPVFDRALHDSVELDLPLELALHVTDRAESQFMQLASLLQRQTARVARVLLFRVGELVTHRRCIEMAQRLLMPALPNVPLAGGTNTWFVYLNRNRPSSDACDLVSFDVNPQVHASDDASLFETLPCQAAMVETCRGFAQPTRVIISPISLRPRFSPAATEPPPPVAPNELPPEVDPRQLSLLAAAWTVGSIKHLAQAGIASVTYYETTGPRGIMETVEGSPVPLRFPSLTDSVFPLYHVLADCAGATHVAFSASSHPLRADMLALRTATGWRVLIANYAPEAQTLALALPATAAPRLRLLDTEHVLHAMQAPDEFRQATTPWDPAGDLTLPPYAVATIEWDE
jgi:hypothetical protein